MICVLVEDVLIEIFLSQSSFARVFSKTKPYTTMLRLLKETQSSWPPLTQAGSEVKKSEHDDKSEASPRPLATNVEFQVVDEKEAFQQFSSQRGRRLEVQLQYFFVFMKNSYEIIASSLSSIELQLLLNICTKIASSNV